MHEGAIAAAIIQGALEALEREKIAAARAVTVLIGRMHHVVPDVLQDHYRLLKKEYPALSRSKLLIEIVPVRITCRACGKETEIVKPEFACPGCGSTSIDITGGREMHLKEVIGIKQTKKDEVRSSKCDVRRSGKSKN
jgi:hydrogenase nickel incorporation protein HypA/HybF